MPGLQSKNLKVNYKEEELKVLKVFFSNPGGNVFVLLDSLTPEMKAALVARYSRSNDLSMQKLFLREFYGDMELQLVQILANIYPNICKDNNEKVQKFNNRVLNEYGDDSVREIVTPIIGVELIDQITAKIIEDSKLFSGIEKSTRYLDFSKGVELNEEGEIIGYDKNSRVYLYLVPESIEESNYKNMYESTLDELFEFYKKLEAEVFKKLKEENPLENQKFPSSYEKDELISYDKLSEEEKEAAKKAYDQALMTQTHDVCRNILPMATLTNLGWSSNFREVGEKIAEMLADKNKEVNKVGDEIYKQLKFYAPTLINWIELEHGKEYINNIKMRKELDPLVERYLNDAIKEYQETNDIKYSDEDIKLLRDKYENDAEVEFVTSILYPFSSLDYKELEKVVKSNKELQNVTIDWVKKLRGDNRRNKLPNAGENVGIKIEFNIPISIWRDLQRHRNLTQLRQEYTIFNGYEIPEKVEEIGYGKEFMDKIDAVNNLYIALHSKEKTRPYAQEVVTFSHKIKTVFTADLKEWTWMIELRTSKQGDPRYVKLMRELYEKIVKEIPFADKIMVHVNKGDNNNDNDDNLGRLYSLYKNMKRKNK